MSIENITLAHFMHFIRRGGFSSLFTNLRAYKALHLSRILYKSTLFMQNKPNLVRRRRIANIFITMTYENKSNWTLGQNKPNSNPNKPNLVRRRRIANVYDTKDYRKKDDFVVRINKPNLQNAKNERKLIFYRGL
ncbi:MAG: hypothetical protein ACETWQ_20215 [Phycisphaerae bacterium]